MGGESSLASTYYPPVEDDDITWGAHGATEKEIVYYFGQIINPQIQQITVFDEDVPIITSHGNRFFFKKVKGESLLQLPRNIKAFSKSGELIYSTLPDTP
ncbi:hypothetical protein M9R32_11055 [Paenisporosarcina quisquiliarum]|uniref:Uncharacterized protein n=1 Tax=Paenisporosarcina quisquiliarum TaxID=365346 RepID=A0A9X3RDN1_9BACL|nr:hypothetical protein [Paenisporosarcina quisquiliarum]MCZ8537721.1 hypothetical protein [Paenisporosarcina quisquiliarum]